MTVRPVVVIGAGAAGTMAAIHAARSTTPVLLLERTADGGRKILISGGGRCNILPGTPDHARFVTDSPRPRLRHILRGWPAADQRRFFEADLGLPLRLEEETGKLFPEVNRARVVRDRLLEAARQAGVALHFGVRVQGLAPDGDRGWRVFLEGAEPVRAGRVVVATGGLSVPSTGSDGAGLDWLAALGLRIRPTYPALTPLTGGEARHHALAGISVVTRITATGPNRCTSTGGLLFTHRGWSGPAILDLSHLATRSAHLGEARRDLRVAWIGLDVQGADAWLAREAGTAGTALRRRLPARLADLLLDEAGVEPAQALAQLRRTDRQRLAGLLGAYPLPWTGDEGYRKAEVTGGGVALDEVDHFTLESGRWPGLHVCGEALDAFGPIGGHNFQWAWATGYLAGRSAGAQPVS